MAPARWLFRLARWSPAGKLAGWVFAHLSFALPLKRLRETPSLLAFQHPKPAHAVHILIVPRRAIRGFEALTADDRVFLLELVQTVQNLVAELGLEERGYRLVANGGSYQEIPQLHFHLIAD